MTEDELIEKLAKTSPRLRDEPQAYVRAVLRKGFKAGKSVAIRVKPLVWKRDSRGLTCGFYHIYVHESDDMCVLTYNKHILGNKHADSIVAMTAAQTHHEKIILEALL